jgi:hypothetical protein
MQVPNARDKEHVSTSVTTKQQREWGGETEKSFEDNYYLSPHRSHILNE